MLSDKYLVTPYHRILFGSLLKLCYFLQSAVKLRWKWNRSLTSWTLQVPGSWSCMTTFRCADIRTCRWCGKCCKDRSRSSMVITMKTIPSATSSDRFGEFLYGLTIVLQPHLSRQIMLRCRSCLDNTKSDQNNFGAWSTWRVGIT